MIENKEEILPDLIRKYKAGQSLHKLAGEYDAVQSTIRRWLQEAGVELRHRKKRIDINKDKLKGFADQGMTAEELTNYFCCSRQTIKQRMDEYGIKTNMKVRTEKMKQKIEQSTTAIEKKEKPPKKKCSSCVFRARKHAVNGCNYVVIVRRCRMQPALNCTYYEKGKRIDPESKRAEEKRLEIWEKLKNQEMAAGGTR